MFNAWHRPACDHRTAPRAGIFRTQALRHEISHLSSIEAQDRSQPPLYSPSPPGPYDIVRRELPNGITILVRPNKSSLSVVVTGYLSAGAIFEPDDKLGLAGFTALSLMRGTTQRDFQQIYEALESSGASLGIDGGTHTIGFYGHDLAEDLDLLSGTLSQTWRHPIFPSDQVERLRDQ